MPRVHAVNRLTPTIIEVVVHAPAAARGFRPGQFYRLQNYEMLAQHLDEPGIGTTRLAMEGLAMTGAWTDPARGLVSVIALEMGGSSDLCAQLKPGEPVVLMGPTGTPTEIHAEHDGRAGRRRPRQRGAVQHRRGDARGRIEGDLLRRLQEADRSLQGRGDRARRRRDRVVQRRGAGLRAQRRPSRRTAVSSATSWRRWRPTARGAWASRRCRWPRPST